MSCTNIFQITLSPNNAPIHTKVIKLYLSYIQGTFNPNGSNVEKPQFNVKEINDEFKMVELTHGARVVRGSFAVLLYLEKHFHLDMLKFGDVGSVERALIYAYSTMTVQNFKENINRFENNFICHRSYALGHSLSLADFYVFVILNACAALWNEKDFTSTKRYFNFICNLPQFNEQELQNIFGNLPEIKFNILPFEFKPLPELFENATGSGKGAAAPQKGDKKGDSKSVVQAEKVGKQSGDAKSQGKKKEKKAKAPKAQPKAQTLSPNVIDIRVGRIVEAIRHPEADKLYIEQIEIGEEKPRQIVSGLYQKIPLEKLQGSLCLVMVNLKPAVMVGVESSGMLLSAVTGDGVQFDTLCIPEGTVPGERVTFTGSNQEEKPDSEVNSKKLRKYMPNFKSNDKGQVFYDGDIPHIARTSKGIITSPFNNGLVA